MPLDADHRLTAHPHLALCIALHMNPPGAAQDRALARDVMRGRKACADQPLAQGGIQTSGDRVLGQAPMAWEKRPDLESLCWTVRALRDA